MRTRAWWLMLCLAVSPLVPAQETAMTGAEILDDAAGAGAEIDKLKAETELLGTIGKGVSLSLAQCAGVENCEPTVNRAELERLVATVEQRINGLVPRQSESGVEDLLVAYATVRDTYNAQLGKLGEIAPEPEAAADEGDAFSSEPASEPTESAATPEEFSIFEDADESFTDEPAEDEGVEPEAPQ